MGDEIEIECPAVPFRPSERPRDLMFAYVQKKLFDIGIQEDVSHTRGAELHPTVKEDKRALEAIEHLLTVLEQREIEAEAARDKRNKKSGPRRV